MRRVQTKQNDGKEITVSIEDALFSPKSMNIMFGSNGANISRGSSTILKTTVVTLAADSTVATTGVMPDRFTIESYDSVTGMAKKQVIYMGTDASNPAGTIDLGSASVTLKSFYQEDGTAIDTAISNTPKTDWQAVSLANKVGQRVFIKYEVPVISAVIKIDSSSFPGTYYVTGDTYARSDKTGEDDYFQFIIPKAKMTAENTITLEAEGDPSVFNMNLTVLRPENGEMMQLVQYELTSANG